MKLTPKYKLLYSIRKNWEKLPYLRKLALLARLKASHDMDVRLLAENLENDLTIVSLLKPT